MFRASPHATMDNVAAARYLLAKKKDVTIYSGINQNYAWGQDSWRDFVSAMKVLAPKAKVDKELFPKLFAGEYGAEISTLLTSKSQALHTSFWDGDLESFIYQEQARGLDKRMPIIGTDGRGVDLAAEGQDAGRHHHRRPRPERPARAATRRSNKWFQKIYIDRYSTPPTYPSYQMAQSLLGLKLAWEKAQRRRAAASRRTDEVADRVQGHRVRRRRAAT